MNERRPGVGLAVVILREGKVLLGLRKSEHGEGTWGFPGGHLEFGESWEECARRECLEETGLEPHAVMHWTVTNDIFETGKHYVTLFMLAEARGEPQVTEPDKCVEWRWIAWDEMPPNVFLPIRNLIKNGYNPFTL